MSDTVLDRIPEHLRDAVKAALSASFGSSSVEAHQPMTGGASGALALRITVKGRDYVLRVEARRSPLRNPHQYTCMRIAAEAGIAPPLHYVDGELGISVIDYIVQQPLAANSLRALATLLSELHATSLFPAVGDYRNLVRRLLTYVQSGFAPGLLDAHRESFERIVAAYPWNPAAHVSSHNDPNARNTLFDGNRLWLIDWETAYRNDPFTDVAILAENHAPSPGEATTLLHEYLGREPRPADIARLRLMRQMVRLYYAGLMLSPAVNPATPMNSLAAPSPGEFRASIASGELSPVSRETLVVLGKVCLAGFISECGAPGYEESLARASEG
jgi:aminoglycoside phosphotransferase (APT) family kinase protein